MLYEDQDLILPYLGGCTITDGNSTWRIAGAPPKEHGWYRVSVDGSKFATLLNVTYPPNDWAFGHDVLHVKGYVVGNRIIPDRIPVSTDPKDFIPQTKRVFLLPTLTKFSRVKAAYVGDRLVYVKTLPAYDCDNKMLDIFLNWKNVDYYDQISPALQLAFNSEVAFHLESQILFNERMSHAKPHPLSSDFETTCRNLWEPRGLDLLSFTVKEDMAALEYLFEGEKLRCTVHIPTLQVVDSGLALLPTFYMLDLTLANLPHALREVADSDTLVKYR